MASINNRPMTIWSLMELAYCRQVTEKDWHHGSSCKRRELLEDGYCYGISLTE